MTYKFSVGEVVDVINRKNGSTIGIICKTFSTRILRDGSVGDTDIPYYYTLVWQPSEKRFWCEGTFEDEMISRNFTFVEMIESFQHWMNAEFSTKTGIKLNPEKFGEKYDYWKIRKERGAERAKR